MKPDHAPVTQLPVSPSPGKAARGTYRVYVRDLVLPANIGVYERERLGPQRVRINVDLKVEENRAPLDDDIANVYSYADVIAGIRDIIAGGHINLVETLAERIAAFCLADRRVVSARVGVDKLDVEPDAAAVGVEIERTAS